MNPIARMSIGLAVLSLIISLVTYQTQKASALRMTLRLNQRTYLLHEPMTAVVTFENGGSESILLPREAELLSERFVIFDIVNDKNEKIGYIPMASPSSIMYPPDYRGIPLKPGEKYSVWYDLTCQESGGRSDLVWNNPGFYRVTVRYQWLPGLPENVTKIKSSSIAIEARVVNPTGNDQKAHELLVKGANLDIWNLSDAQTKIFSRLIRQWPESGYTKYARFFLAQKAESRARMNGFERSSVDAAVKTWLAASKDVPPYSFDCYCQERAAMLLLEVKRYDESAAIWRKMLKDRKRPDSQRLMAEEFLKKMGAKIK